MTVGLTNREKQDLAYLRRLEEELAPILKDAPGNSDLTDPPRSLIRRAMDFAWAVRTFPLFDPSCLGRQMVKQKVSNRMSGHETFDGELWVPVLACVGGGVGHARWDAKQHSMYTPCGSISLSGKLVEENQKIIDAWTKERHLSSWTQVLLEATVPTAPSSVARNVKRIGSRFEEIAIVFEADWGVIAVKDPLVIGKCIDHWFLLDQYDMTKLERYISSEYCQGPEKSS